jgi:Asp/Glu/hydantoin racemase
MRCECSTLTCLEACGGEPRLDAKVGLCAANAACGSALAVCVGCGAIAELAQNLPDHFGRKAAPGKKPGLSRSVGK